MTILDLAYSGGCRNLEETVIYIARNYDALKKYSPKDWFSENLGNVKRDELMVKSIFLLNMEKKP